MATKGSGGSSGGGSFLSSISAAIQSSSLISSVVASSSSNGNRLFSSSKKGEISELKAQLNSTSREKKKTAVKKVIAAMTLGRDVSSLFPQVVNCMQTSNLELKKLVYLYVISFARLRPDLALLAINTFRKDTLDPSPVVRALAIRTMGCIRLPQIVEYVVEPIQRLLRDPDAYVRKCAVLCVAKLHETSSKACHANNFVQMLQSIVADGTENAPIVLVNALSALEDIYTSELFDLRAAQPTDSTTNTHTLSQEEKLREMVTFDLCVIERFIDSLSDINEWGQVSVLDFISSYFEPPSPQVATQITAKLTARLAHANCAVVLAASRLILRLIAYVREKEGAAKADAQFHDVVHRRLIPSVISMFSSEISPELQFVLLKSIQVIGMSYPEITCIEYSAFFLKFNDPPYLKFEKLLLLSQALTASPSNATQDTGKTDGVMTDGGRQRPQFLLPIGECLLVLEELQEYSHVQEPALVCAVVRTIGRVLIQREDLLEDGLRIFTNLLDTRVSFIVEETIIVLRDVCLKYVGKQKPLIPNLVALVSIVEDYNAAGALISVVAEHTATLPPSELSDFFQANRKIFDASHYAHLHTHTHTYTHTSHGHTANGGGTGEFYASAGSSAAAAVASSIPAAISFQHNFLSFCVKVACRHSSDFAGPVDDIFNQTIGAETLVHPNVRDKAFFYQELLKDPELAEKVLFTARPPLQFDYFRLSPPLQKKLVNELGLMSAVFQEHEASFLTQLENKYAVPQPELSALSTEEEEMRIHAETSSSCDPQTRENRANDVKGTAPGRERNLLDLSDSD